LVAVGQTGVLTPCVGLDRMKTWNLPTFPPKERIPKLSLNGHPSCTQTQFIWHLHNLKQASVL